MEAVHLALFMLSASIFGVLLEHPASALHQHLDDPFLRRILMGLAMGLTAVAIVKSPFGQRSGAHMNPAVTLTYWSLGKVRGIDAVFYALGQFAGAILGMAVAWLLIGMSLGNGAVNYLATLPGPGGAATAFAAEFGISFLLMISVLAVSNNPRIHQWTPLVAGALVALFITFEAPLSGMSMNPARTLGSALASGEFGGLWIYFTAPPLGMLFAGTLYQNARRVYCAKLGPHGPARCIFHCDFKNLENE